MLKKISSTLSLALALSLAPFPCLANTPLSLTNPTADQQTQQNPNVDKTQPGDAVDKTQQGLDPRAYNVLILSDERLLIMMAAVNLAGYDYDPNGQPQGLRAQLRADLKNTPPELVNRLRAYYSAHRNPAREEIAQVSPYIGLALALSGPPSLSTPAVIDKLPPDVREIVDFVPLLQEFYVRSPIKELIPKYKLKAINNLKAESEQTASTVLYETLGYLRTQPRLYLPPTPIFNPDDDTAVPGGQRNKDKKADKDSDKKDKRDKNDKNSKDDKDNKPQLSQPRVRRLLIFLNPFAPPGSVISRNDILNGTDIDVPRRLGDDYCIIASEQSLKDHIRHGFIRFVLDPIVGKSSVEIANLKEKIDPLLTALPNAKEKARRNVYEVVGESLARAVGVRLTLRGSGGSFTADDASYVLSQYYEQGAVLVFHFYDGLKDLERAGIDIAAFVEPYLNKIDFEREGKRLEETKAARARIDERRAAVKSIIDVDTLIKERKYELAQAQLETILKEQPRNARALFGMAQITNNQPSNVELDPNSDDEDKIGAQNERLAKALSLYRSAIEAANPQEQWLVSQSHVLIGRIFDFVEERQQAIAEYEKAIQLGDIPKGAYREALEGKQRPLLPNRK